MSRTFSDIDEAQESLIEVRHELNIGTFIPPSDITVAQYIEQWLPGERRGLRKKSFTDLKGSLRPYIERLGSRLFQSVTKADINDVATWMETKGRKRGGKPGTGLGPSSVRKTLRNGSRVWETARIEGIVRVNVVALVTLPAYSPPEQSTWKKDGVATFLRRARKDRLHLAFRLSLYGLRRGEVLGLRWEEDIEWGSLAEPCAKHRMSWCAPCYQTDNPDYKLVHINIRRTRVTDNYEVYIEEPKSDESKRRLPLDRAAALALHDLQVLQVEEAAAAGTAYNHSGWVVVDSLGNPPHPDWYSDEFLWLTKMAGLPRIKLHGSRHTTFSLMHKAGVPIAIIAKWAGHADPAFTMRTYVHADDEDLKVGLRALTDLHSD
ncbi:tyrosine-type recombinase/integrase [Amycolatopsis sp. WGS_07]|uniref:tyrosine-type recombinase/integrase n=1 Tax=Amycolatopsis sp. WGS_07 TaxID=3076764 RepID=UPI003872E5E4